jgi:hypothetical protein
MIQGMVIINPLLQAFDSIFFKMEIYLDAMNPAYGGI